MKKRKVMIICLTILFGVIEIVGASYAYWSRTVITDNNILT